MSCQTALELLPWLLNGSLEEAQRRELVAHLSGCDDCRAELWETREAWELLALHVPSWDLAAYGHGLPPAEWSRQDVERHLALCPRCRSDLAAVRDAGLETGDAEPARELAKVVPIRSAWVRWTRLPLAAALAGAVLLGFWLATLERDLESNGTPSAHSRIASAGNEPLYSDGFESGTVIQWSGVLTATSTATSATHRLQPTASREERRP